MKINCNFTYIHYVEILNLLKEKKYKFSSFTEKNYLKNPRVKKIFLRHDIDLSPEMALPLAKLESKEKVSSIYFIRVASPFYNVFQPKNALTIERIIKMGHQIGLHFEADRTISIYSAKKPSQRMIEDAVLKQIILLNSYFKMSNVVSFHCPHKARFVLNKKFNKFISAYSPDFFKKTKYLSDSMGIWREGCPCKWLKKDNLPNNLQLLMHPLWWGRNKNDKLNSDGYYYQIFQENFKKLDLLSARENPFYKSRLSK